MPYSGLKRLAEDTGMEFDLKEPAGDEIIKASHLYLLSLMTDRSHVEVTINGKSYNQIKDTNIPYLGYLQESMSFYVVNDEEYEHLLPLGQELYTYNYQIADLERFEEAREALHTLTSNTEENYTARVAIDPDSSDIDWIKVLYSICIFMFLVFILASGSIMFMKVYNDAFEEKERYLILKKMGFESKILHKSVAREVGMAYGIPFIVMSISSYFSVHALEQMMYTSLMSIQIGSVLIVLIIFVLCYCLSVSMYWRNIEI